MRHGWGGEAAEESEAKLLVLEQGLAMLVPASEQSAELVIDLRPEATKLVHRVRASDLEVGMAILVRTDGGGDYVVPAADQILAHRKQELRNAQQSWKHALRTVVRERGFGETVQQLKAAGSQIACDQNLRNWISPRSIRTMHLDDFAAIHRVIDSSGSLQELWTNMGIISTAHLRAGAMIRRRLLEQAQTADLSTLLRDGRMDLKLPGELGGAALTAIRITNIPRADVRVPWSAFHRLIPTAS
jgi:hypothetical protein